MKEIPGDGMPSNPLCPYLDRAGAAHIWPQEQKMTLRTRGFTGPTIGAGQNQGPGKGLWQKHMDPSSLPPPSKSARGGLGMPGGDKGRDPIPQDLGCTEGPPGCQLLPIQEHTGLRAHKE